MYKGAVFDIKPTYNHQIFIQGVQLHSPKISFGEGGGRTLTDGDVVPLIPLEPPLGIRLAESGFGFMVKPVSDLVKKSIYLQIFGKTGYLTSVLFVYHKLHCLLPKDHSIWQVNITLVYNLNPDLDPQ